MLRIPLAKCPTCGESGSYRYRGETEECDCSVQKTLRKHYLLANIGDQYQRLDWANDYTYSDKTKELVAAFLAKWDNFKLNGMGIEFYGADLGVGKTFAATYVAKQLIQKGERVYFIPFQEVVSAYQRDNKEALEDRLKTVTVLVLDEVTAPTTQAQHNLFAGKFEELIRHRTNYNLPTIVTTNLAPKKLMDYYPRTYSLLSAKQLRIEMSGPDARQNRLGEENLELALNDEIRPIS